MSLNLTLARRRILKELRDSGPVDEMTRVFLQFRRDVLDSLEEQGLIKYRPYGKPPTWAITDAGREALE